MNVSMPGHGDLTALMSQMAFFLCFSKRQLYRFIPRSIERFVRIAVLIDEFGHTRVVRKKTREKILASLGF